MILQFKERKPSPRLETLTPTQKKNLDLLPLDERRMYVADSFGEDEMGEYVVIEFYSKYKLPKEWFVEVEPVQEKPGHNIIHKGYNRKKPEEVIGKNPYATTLKEYQDKIDKNTQKAYELSNGN